ncbi:dihydropyrimidinase [Oscillospiraceae bacterium PP1C4]
MKKLIKNGMVVSDSQTFLADVLIEDEKISLIGVNLECADAQVIDAAGKYVIPGAVDVHTHMDLQAGAHRAVDDFYDGTVAAACGGTTTIVDHIAFGPKGCSLWHQVNEYHKLAENKAVIDYGFHGVIQHVDDKILEEMEEISQAGITSFKIYMTYDFKLSDMEIYRVLKKAKEIGAVIAVHAENDGIINYLRACYKQQGLGTPAYHPKSRPAGCEAEAISRMFHIAAMADDAPVYIVHLSSGKGLLEVRKAFEEHQKHIGIETCIQYLMLTDERYSDEENALKYVMSPPLRKQEDCDALWKGIEDGTVQVVATDHCPFHFDTKKQFGAKDFTSCPNGAPGVEERVRLMFSEGVMKNKISIHKFVEVLCTNPSKMFGLYPQKGTILPGSDADIVIIDPSKRGVITHEKMHGASDYSAYEGFEVLGDIDLVIQRGEIIVRDNQFLGKKGSGRFIKRSKSVLVR